MKKSTKSVDRAFAVISTIGTAIKASPEPTYELKIIQDRVNKMMQVYRMKVGKEYYWKISNEVGEIWGELAEESNIIAETSINVLAEALCNIIHKNTFEKMLSYQQPEINCNGISKEDFVKISYSVLRINDKFNSYFETKSCIYTLSKPKVVKAKKEKVKKKSKAQLKHEEEQEKIRIAKDNKKKALQEMIRKAREKKDSI